ncbi:MAG: DNA-3-methyladenine glycosylase family protein [Alphaproteobacteria bacterium]
MSFTQPMRIISSNDDIDAGISALITADPRLEPIAKTVGRPPLRRKAGGFCGLADIVISQQVSLASATAIRTRVEKALGVITGQNVLAAGANVLADAGLSGAKVRTFLGVAGAEAAGDFSFSALENMSDDAVEQALVALKGIGPWSANVYLLGCLGRADVWPAGDVALQEAVKLALGLQTRPSAGETIEHAQAWRPWRAVAARLLWSYYGMMRGQAKTSKQVGGTI